MSDIPLEMDEPEKNNDTHKRSQLTKGPLCMPRVRGESVYEVADNIDDIDCANCLRLLAKDAGRYGNERRPRR